jgi:hypothetical protein
LRLEFPHATQENRDLKKDLSWEYKKSLKNTEMWKLRLRPHNFVFGRVGLTLGCFGDHIHYSKIFTHRMRPDSESTKLLDHPKIKAYVGRGLRKINGFHKILF